MLHISENPVQIDEARFGAFQKIALANGHKLFRAWLFVLFGLALVFMFLPWTQNVRAKDRITTLSLEQRPQTIHATIAGRIEQWYVHEGQLVQKGDTILRLSEIKTEYFDPHLLARTQAQVNAKAGAAQSYEAKASALDAQTEATRRELVFKKQQLTNKIAQTKLKAEGEKSEIEAARIDLQTEEIQLKRAEELFEKGLQTRTALENKRLKFQQARAKLVVSENKYTQTVQEMDNLQAQLNGIENEYASKIAKSESDKFSTLSEKFDAEGNVSKPRWREANAVNLRILRLRGIIDLLVQQIKSTLPTLLKILKLTALRARLLKPHHHLPAKKARRGLRTDEKVKKEASRERKKSKD